MHITIRALVVTLLATGIARGSDPSDVDSVSAGSTKAHPIDVCKPDGERQYLSQLVCPNGEYAMFERAGSVGPRNPLPKTLTAEERDRLLQSAFNFGGLEPGEVDTHIVDAYTLQCGARTTTLYLDMYHCPQNPPATAPAGFMLAR